MSSNKKLLLHFVFVFFIFNTIQAQKLNADVLKFKEQDSIAFPPNNAILFIGSSSFTKWTDVSSYFPNHIIVNRAFGGSTLLDVIDSEKDIIFPYKPKQIVIYCGENDIAYSDNVSGEMVLERFKTLYYDIRKVFPKVSIVYISMKPCPSRWKMKERLINGNKLISQFIKKEKNTVFVSVWEKMLDSNNQPKPEIFVDDQLHMNAQGYSIWQKAIAPVLLK